MHQKNTKKNLTSAIKYALLYVPLISTAVNAQTNDGVFNLGNIVVTGGILDQKIATEDIVTSEELQRFNRNTVGDAVNMLPGVSMRDGGPRNEQTIHLRGFDSRQVPVFIDGIPQYVPYDGNIDLGRFTTFDYSEVRVAKGAASLLYGPNIMGGAVNLVTRKPTKEIEGNIRLGFAEGNEQLQAINVGTNQGLWYLQASSSSLSADSFNLGKGFKDGKDNPTDTGNRRKNAYRTDKKGSFKLGITPNDTDEYALSYSKQEGEKGQPVYAGNNPEESARYWQWPYWDKESVYFLSTTALGNNNTIKTRAYQDKYKNAINMYDDPNYQELDEHSPYDDKTYGAALEWVNTSFDQHELHLAIHHKDDRHNDGLKRYRDVTQSVAFEDMVSFNEAWRMRVGASYEKRKALKVFEYEKGSTTATNGLVEVMHDLTKKVEIYTSAAQKTRLPTIKDRYSARMGRAIPSPDLKPEVAFHAELGLRGEPWSGAYGGAAIFYSRVTDEIQTAITSVMTCGKDDDDACDQAQNIGKTRHQGVELSLDQMLGESWRIGAAYTYLERDNLSDKSIKLTDTPTHKLFTHASWMPTEQLELQANLNAETGRDVRYRNAKGSPDTYPTQPSFAVAGLKGAYSLQQDLTFELGVRNLTDKNYAYSEGYPMPGRTWFAGANYSF